MRSDTLPQAQHTRRESVSPEFVFSYRNDASECLVALLAKPGSYISSFIVRDPIAPRAVQLAIAVTHRRSDTMAAPDAIAECLLTEFYAHTGPRQLPPSAHDHKRLKDELTHWLQVTALEQGSRQQEFAG